ncbi:hypothetical protein AWV79_28215 [Cupriavidus sp. UYMMa02A]|nr:hypothetical protein AWV79_28215 [Cupriavidus sp. UYMMa02A]
MPGNLLSLDGFTESELTTAIHNLPPTPTLLGDERIFVESGIPTTKASLDLLNGQIKLIPDSPRGAPPVPYQREKRSTVQVATSHFRPRARIMADTWQDVRGVGTSDLENTQQVQNRYLVGMRANLDATIEYQRMMSLTGQVTDVTGALAVDLFATFGQTQQVQGLALGTTTSYVPNLIQEAKRKAERALPAGIKPKGWLAVVSPDLLDALRAHTSLTASFQGWQAATALRDDVRNDFNITGVRFAEVVNPEDSTGLPEFIAEGTGYLIPLGIPDLFHTYFGPADTFGAMNQVGIPYYVKPVVDPYDRYIDLEAQSNPISIITRPRAVVKLTVA